jgi:hypothetical protein
MMGMSTVSPESPLTAGKETTAPRATNVHRRVKAPHRNEIDNRFIAFVISVFSSVNMPWLQRLEESKMDPASQSQGVSLVPLCPLHGASRETMSKESGATCDSAFDGPKVKIDYFSSPVLKPEKSTCRPGPF